MAKAFGNRGRKNRGNYTRKNERIRAKEVRLIGPDSKNYGVVSRDEALKVAKQLGLDLVEISNKSNPPVCQILEFGKYMYEQSKRNKENKAKGATSTKIKEVKFRVRIEEHDYMTKLRHAEEFLYKGNKLKLSLMFRGREMEHQDLGMEVVKRATRDLQHVGTAEGEPRKSGRHISHVLTPLPASKRKLIYNSHVEESDDDEAPAEE